VKGKKYNQTFRRGAPETPVIVEAKRTCYRKQKFNFFIQMIRFFENV